MSKIAYLTRYSLIIRKLKRKPFSTYEEIAEFINREQEFLRIRDEDLHIPFSLRTLQRDIRDIRNIMGIEIKSSGKGNGYYIVEQEGDNEGFNYMLEAFETFHAFKVNSNISQYIHNEQRPSKGTEHLYGLMHAIKNNFQVQFCHQKYWEDEVKQRRVSPYGLKEFRNRWYVVGKDHKDDEIKTFGLDRISDLEILNRAAIGAKEFDLQEYFRYSFGIIQSGKEDPQDIILSFTPFQGKYIKSLPLHPTQKILEENEEELRISLRLYITHDFIMELLSMAGEVEVVKPASLRRKIEEELARGISKNKE